MTSSRVQNILGSISKLLECAICLDLLKNPVITRCNHNFCRFCITEFLRNKKSVPCPLCKESVTKRSLQEQERLNEIVSHVRGLITAYQEDTGELFSPPRGHQVDSAFFPCTPEHIFSQENKPQAEHRKQPKRNVKHAKKTQAAAAADLGDINTLNEVTNILGLEDDSEVQVPEDLGPSTSTGTCRVRRTRTAGKAFAAKGDKVGLVAKAGSRSRSDLEKEAALLQYLDEGSCGVGDPETGDVLDEQHHDLEKDDTGDPAEAMEVDLDAKIYQTGNNFPKNTEHSSGGKHLTSNLESVYIVEKMAVEDPQLLDDRKADSPTDESNPPTRNVLDPTPESAYKEEECESGNEVIEVDLDAEIDQTGNNFHNDIECSSGVKDLTINLEPVCVEKMTVDDPQVIDNRRADSPTNESNLPTRNVLDLTPESAYEGEECESGDELYLFQSQEVKQKEKASKVKLSIYSGKKTDTRTSRLQNVLKTKQQYEVDFDDGSIMSSLENPTNLGRDFQNLGQVKTYSKSRVEKNKKNNMVKQWVQKAQVVTGNHSFSESDSQTTHKSTRILNGHKDISTDGECRVEFDDFGFTSLLDSTEDDTIGLIRTEASKMPSPVATQNRKKIFKTKITKETRPGSDGVKHPEAELPSSDPYEFKSSQTPKKHQNNKKQPKKKEQKQAKGKKGSKLTANTGRTAPAKTEGKDERHTEQEEKDEEDLIEVKSDKKLQGKKEKHVRFDLKSPEEEMSHLINKIGEAEDHDFLFSTQEALSNMPEQAEEEEEDTVIQLEKDNIDEATEADFVTVTDNKNNHVDENVKTDTELQASDTSGTEKSESLSVVPPTPLLPIRPMAFMTKGSVKEHGDVAVPKRQECREQLEMVSGEPKVPQKPLPVVPETPGTAVPHTLLLQETEGELTGDKANSEHLQDDIHLTDSESCSQMPLPIPRKSKGTNKLGTKHLSKEIISDASQSTGSGKSHVSPTPKMVLKEKEGLTSEEKNEFDDNKPCSDASSSTEDLDITPDQTQFEEANLDLQPEDVRKQLSQMSQESVRKTTLVDRTSVNINEDQPTSTKSRSGNFHPLSESQQQKSFLYTDNVPCGETEEDNEKTVAADSVGEVDTTVETTDNADLESAKTLNMVYTESGSGRPNTNRNNEADGDNELPESIDDPSPDVIEDTVVSSNRSTRSCRTRGNQNKTGNISLGLKQRVTKKCPKKMVSESKVIEIDDSEEEGVCGPEGNKSDVRTVNSQASTVPTSLQPESLPDEQTLPPDECMDDLADSQDQEIQEEVIEAASADVSTGVPETVTESVSLLDPLVEEDDDALNITSKSQEASTLESVSILHDQEKQELAAVDEGRSKQKKRKYCEEITSEVETLTTPKDQRQDSSAPEVSSAPVTVNLDDSDDEMLVIRRPKRKCFSLDGSPLKARAKTARARLTRRTKPHDRSHLSVEQEQQQKPALELMDTDKPVDQVPETHDSNSHQHSKLVHKISDHHEEATKLLSEADESEDLQLINTIPALTEPEQSMEDIFNRNSEVVCVPVPSDEEDIISNSTEIIKSAKQDNNVSNSTAFTSNQAPQKKVKRSQITDSDTSDSDDEIQSTSVRKGVRAVRGLASRLKKTETSPIVLSSGSVSSQRTSSQITNKVMNTASPSKVHVNESHCSRKKLTPQDSECLGPTPNNFNVSDSNKKPKRKAKNSKGHSTRIHSDSDGDSDNDVTIIQSFDSDLSGRTRRNQTRKRNKTKQADSIKDCQVGISPSEQMIEDKDDAETLQDLEDDEIIQKNTKKHTVYSSSDEEFVLHDDDEIIRKAEMPTVNDAYTELPQTSSPIQGSPRKESSGDESDVTAPPTRKNTCPIITDSESDDDSYHSDQQMNFTSSSAFSSQSEVLSTQQQGKLEKDVQEMRDEIRQLEELKKAVLDKDGVTEVEECTTETPDVIPPSNKTKEEEDSSSDGELFLSPMSPSPPPPVSTGVSESPAWATDKKSQKVIEAFEIIEKYKSPDLSKTKRSLEGVSSSKVRRDNDGEVCRTTKPSPALSKKKGERAPKIEDSGESDLPLVTSPLGAGRWVKKERLSDRPSGSRKVLSPLVFENRKKTVSKQIVMITSGLAGEQMVSVQEFLGKTGSAFFPKFSKTVTHVIVRKAVGEGDQICDRTLKYFQGVVAKCWVLSFDWIRDSLQAGKPLPEEPYEMVGDTVSREHHYGPRRSRLSEKKLFTGFTFACIGVSREMTKDDMRVLVQLGGAELAEDPWELGNMKSTIRLIIRCLDFEERPNESEIETFNNFYKHYHLVTVSREWVLDSISSFHIQPLKEDYIINTLKKIVLPF